MAAVVLMLLAAVACGRVDSPIGSGDNASPARTASPSPTPNPMAFQTSDCVSPAATGDTYTEPLADYFKAVVEIPGGWTREPPTASEADLIVLDAPASYSNQPTKIEVLNPIGYYPNATPDQVIKRFYESPTNPGVAPVALVGGVASCAVQTDNAAFIQYSQGDRAGYLVIFLHIDSLYGLRLEGSGGVDERAVADAKRVLGSWRWTVASPPPH